MKIISIFIVWVVPFFSVSGQSSINNLLFKNEIDDITRLDFSSDPPSQSDLILSNHFIIANEQGIIGHAEINGEFLFYVTEKGVYRADGSFMMGSEQIEIDWHSSEVNILQMPGQTDKYYIFHKNALCSTLYYSIIDLSASNRLGGVESLNNPLSNGKYANGIEAIRRPGTNNYWFIAYECSSGFEVYEITSEGVLLRSVLPFDISNNAILPPYSEQKDGELDYHNGRVAFASTIDESVAVFDFDPTSGDASSPIKIDRIALPDGTLHDLTWTYGVEFSPDASKLYISRYGSIPTVVNYDSADPYQLYRYDFNTETLSGFTFGDIVPDGLGQIEIGPDGNLYSPLWMEASILKIENPNELNFSFSLIPTSTNLSIYMSDHIQSDVFKQALTLRTETTHTSCLNNADGRATVFVEGGLAPYNIVWKDSEGRDVATTSSGPGVFSASQLAPGTYSISVSGLMGGQGSAFVSITPPSSASIVSRISAVDSAACAGSSINFLNLSFSESVINRWAWSFGDGSSDVAQNPTHKYSGPGVYDVSLSITDKNGCEADTTLADFITIHRRPHADFNVSAPDNHSNCGLEVVFRNASSDFTSLAWNFGDDQTSDRKNPTHLYREPGNYVVQLRAVNEFLCEDTTYSSVAAQNLPILFTPNTFTPNGDGLNDVFSIRGVCFDRLEMWVYNRWGGLVFHTNDKAVGWNGALDGVPCPVGAYTWKADYSGEQGRFTKHGIINLNR